MKKFVFLFVAISLLSVSSFVSARGNTLILDVDVHESSFNSIVALNDGAVSFNVVGTFTLMGTSDIIGTFRCWGWIDGPPGGEFSVGSVSQVFTFDDRGAIMTQGIEGELLAITGGTGDFNNLRGDALQTFTAAFPSSFDFSIEFVGRGAGF